MGTAATVDSCTTITQSGVYEVVSFTASQKDCIQVQHSDVVLDGGGSEIEADAQRNIVIEDGVSDVTVKYIEFDGGKRNIVAGDTEGVELVGNEFSQGDGYAIVVEGGRDYDIRDNVFTQVDGIAVSAVFEGAVGFIGNSFTQGDDNILIKDSNMSELMVASTPSTQGEYGVRLENSRVSTFSVVNNDFTQGENGVIVVDSIVGALSILKNSFSQGIGVEIIGTSDVSTVDVVDNTFTQIDWGFVARSRTTIGAFTANVSKFTQVDKGITVADASAASHIAVLNNDFMQGGDGVTIGSPSDGTGISVVRNSFTQPDDAIRIEHPDGKPATAIHCNTFVQAEYGVYADIGAGIINASNNVWNSLFLSTSRPESPGRTLMDPITGVPANGWSTYVSESSTSGVSNVHFDKTHDTCPTVNGSDGGGGGGNGTSDTVPPTTFDNYTDNGWEAQAQPVDITCMDNESGCNHIDWQINRSGELLRSGSDGGITTRVVAGQHYVGNLSLHYRGVDNAGNVEGWNTQTVRVTLASRDNYTDDGWKNSSQPVRLVCEHAENKDCGLTWRIWDGPVQVRNDSVTANTTTVIVGKDADGPLILEYWANDTDGNVEGPRNEQRVRIDKITPAVALPENSSWFSTDFSIPVSYWDPGYAGVDTNRCTYQVNDGGTGWSNWSSFDCNEITVTVGDTGADCTNSGEDTCLVRARVYDHAGNVNTTMKRFNIDLIGPSVHCDLHENGCDKPHPVAAGKDVTFLPDVSDPYSGVDHVYICETGTCENTYCDFPGELDSCSYTTSRPLGRRQYCIRAVDNTGNERTLCDGFGFVVKSGIGDTCTLDSDCVAGRCDQGSCKAENVDPPGIDLG